MWRLQFLPSASQDRGLLTALWAHTLLVRADYVPPSDYALAASDRTQVAHDDDVERRGVGVGRDCPCGVASISTCRDR